MTQAFEEFMRQYKATGSEKADGYSRDVFVGLEQHEKEEVFKLLETELPWSAEWLFLIDQEKALVVAKEKEAKLRGDPYQNVYLLQEQIVKHSGDLSYQRHMIDDYSNYTDSLKPRVVDSIDRTLTSDAALEFFKQVILVEVNSSAVARAARHLLDAFKVPCETVDEEEKYKRLLSDLRSDDIQVKRRAIARISTYGSASS